jgi:hypothetical protein
MAPDDHGPPTAQQPAEGGRAGLAPDVARRTFRTLEPCHALVYFCPEADAAYRALGLRGRQGYFASRAAPMGAVTAEVVVATFFNFHHDLVHRSMTGVWATADPAAELRRAAELSRRCAEAACGRPEGRPLFAGHASLPWPSAPHLVLWHAQTLLREFRGDAHVAALLLGGCSGLEALVVHAATGEVPAEVLRTTRAWSLDEWRGAEEALRGRGWLRSTGLSLSDEGNRRRAEVEALTDRLSAPAYAAIGEEACAELRRLARPFSAAIVGSWTAPGPDRS